jgi:hypothetical protein
MASDITVGVFSLVSVISGGALTAFVAQHSEKLSYNREREMRKEDREAEQTARRTQFLITTFSQIHDELDELFPQAISIFNRRKERIDSGEASPRYVSDDEARFAFRCSRLRAALLRLPEGDLRDECSAAGSALMQVIAVETPADVERDVSNVSKVEQAVLSTVVKAMGDLNVELAALH